MKHILLLLTLFFLFSFTNWLHDLDEAKVVAKKEHRYIILNFSGSDWCGPCIRMHSEIFGSKTFQEFAANHLVLLNADFPRLQKNQLSSKQQKINDALADQYNPRGIFPFTVLLNEEGKVLKSWEGFPKESASAFQDEISVFTENGN
jgi:thioredoxin-related protein